jgi:hypothetical protein
MGEITMDLDNGYEDVTIKVHFHFQPYERPTHNYPGCNPDVLIEEVEMVDGTPLDLLPDYQAYLEKEILEDIISNEVSKFFRGIGVDPFSGE